MNSTQTNSEKKVFRVSIIGTTFFALLGVAVYFFTQSQAVLLDGLFSLTSVFLAGISIWVINLSSADPTEKYPFGLIQTRPMLELFKSLILAGFLLIALLDNISAFLSGGRELPGLFIVLYASFSVIGSLGVILALWLVGRTHYTSLVKLEIIQWLEDTLISTAIGIAFAITTWIKHPWIQRYGAYLDSILVVLIVIVFIPTVIKSILKSSHELLLGAPKKPIRQQIQSIVLSICHENALELKNIYIISSGGILYIDIEVQVQPSRAVSWQFFENVRSEVSQCIVNSFSNAETFVAFFPQQAA